VTNQPPLIRKRPIEKTMHGSACPWAKLTEEQVDEIRSRYARGWSRVALAAEYNVARKTIWEIVMWKTWVWLGEGKGAYAGPIKRPRTTPHGTILPQSEQACVGGYCIGGEVRVDLPASAIHGWQGCIVNLWNSLTTILCLVRFPKDTT
jgi:hypothetical protein